MVVTLVETRTKMQLKNGSYTGGRHDTPDMQSTDPICLFANNRQFWQTLKYAHLKKPTVGASIYVLKRKIVHASKTITE